MNNYLASMRNLVVNKIFLCMMALILIGADTPKDSLDSDISPRIIMLEPIRNLELKEGIDPPPEEFIFTYLNEGDAPLTVTVKKTSCGCTKATVLTPRVAPGEKGRLEVKLDAEKFSHSNAIYVLLETNDQAKEELYVQVGVKWIPMLSITPSDTISFGRIPVLKRQVKEIKLNKNFGNTPLEVSIVEVTGNNLKATLNKTKHEKRWEYRCAISLEGSNAPGPFQGELVLKTNIEGYRKLSFGISGIAVGDLRVTPWQINFGNIAPEVTKKRRLIISTNTERFSNAFDKAHTDVPGLELSWETNENVTYLICSLAPAYEEKQIRGTVHLYSKSGEETQIPVLATFIQP